MSQTLYLMLASIGLLVLSGLGTLVAVRLAERRMAPQTRALEDALRVYNSANANLGRHLTTLESEVRDLRQQLASVRQEAAPARPRDRLQFSPPVSMSRFAAALGAVPASPESMPEEACSAAEARLARLISARMPAANPLTAATSRSS
jgi:cell division protein FtsB